jgi:hypothetical protein
MPVPSAVVHVKEVSLIQVLPVHAVPPMKPDGLDAATPKFIPNTVTSAPPSVGALGWLTPVTTGESYDHTAFPVPVRTSTSTEMVIDPPTPAMCDPQSRVVSDIQTDVAHFVAPTDTVGDLLVTPKFWPRMVRVAPPETAALGANAASIFGLSKVKPPLSAPTMLLVVSLTARVLPTPGEVVQSALVVVTNVVLVQSTSLIDPVTTTPATPKLDPEIVATAPPAVGRFSIERAVTAGAS